MVVVSLLKAATRQSCNGNWKKTSASLSENGEKTIFQTNSELAINHDRWFVAKTHTGLNGRLVAAHEVSPLVPVETDAVARAMRQTRRFVIGSKAGVGQNFSRRIIDCFTRRADF